MWLMAAGRETPRMRSMTVGQVQIVDLVKRFAEVTAVDGINVDVAGGEFFSLLGPSGCGKTTTLRLIAGFEQPTEGRVILDGRDVAHTPPHKRNVNTVFLSYALFPFLTVEENVSFGLRYKNVNKNEAKRKAAQALALVQLEGFQKRRPSQLSGGQQQRVALARVLVLNLAVLLLDEPLGALDAKLRKALQIELKALQEEVGVTFIYVTHDQEEALTMSDRLAVMSNGKVEQIGRPAEVYEEPSTAYVADFLGVANMMPALGGGGGRGHLGDFPLVAAGGDVGGRGRIRIVIRPERVDLEDHGTSGDNRIPGMVERVLYVGSTIQVVVHLAHGETLQAWMQNRGGDPPWQQGTAVSVHLPADAIRVLADAAGAGDEGGPVVTRDGVRSLGYRSGAAPKDRAPLRTGAPRGAPARPRLSPGEPVPGHQTAVVPRDAGGWPPRPPPADAVLDQRPVPEAVERASDRPRIIRVGRPDGVEVGTQRGREVEGDGAPVPAVGSKAEGTLSAAAPRGADHPRSPTTPGGNPVQRGAVQARGSGDGSPAPPLGAQDQWRGGAARPGRSTDRPHHAGSGRVDRVQPVAR